MRRRVGLLGLSLVAAVCTQARAGGYVGKEFPNFTAKDAMTGESISLKSLRGQFVLVDFWATW